jgi:hypothetical protein
VINARAAHINKKDSNISTNHGLLLTKKKKGKVVTKTMVKTQLVLINVNNKPEIVITHVAKSRDATVDGVLFRGQRWEAKEVHVYGLHIMKQDTVLDEEYPH